MRIPTGGAQVAVLRRQDDVPDGMLKALDHHLEREDHIRAQGYQPQVEREHVARLKDETIAKTLDALKAIPLDAQAWLDAEVRKLPAEPESYALGPLDEMVLRDGSPAELEQLVERSRDHPTVKQAAERRLEHLHRQPQQRVRDEAFQVLVRLRLPRVVPGRATRLRDLESAAQRRQVLRRDAVLRAAAIANIRPDELSRAVARAALNDTGANT